MIHFHVISSGLLWIHIIKYNTLPNYIQVHHKNKSEESDSQLDNHLGELLHQIICTPGQMS